MWVLEVHEGITIMEVSNLPPPPNSVSQNKHKQCNRYYTYLLIDYNIKKYYETRHWNASPVVETKTRS